MKWIIPLFFISSLQAAELGVKLTDWHRMADDDTYMIGNWQGIQLDYGETLYSWISYDNAQLIPLWGIGDLRMIGIGGGVRQPIGKRFFFYTQVGIHAVRHEHEGSAECPEGPICEGVTYYMADRFQFIDPNRRQEFGRYELNYGDYTFSGLVGFEYRYPVKMGTLTVGLSYRVMRIEEELIVYKDEWNYSQTGWRWEQNLERDLSALGFNIGATF